ICCEDIIHRSEEEEVTDAPAIGEECVEECCLHLIAESLGKHWKDLGRKLHLKDAEIQNISADSSQQKEHGYQVLLKWKKRRGTTALVGELTDALKHLQLSDISDELNKHFKESHITMHPDKV
ncbi:IMD, partial, partial [Paramuricea clavata]